MKMKTFLFLIWAKNVNKEVNLVQFLKLENHLCKENQ